MFKFGDLVKSHFKKLGVIALNLLFGNVIVYFVIGLINKSVGQKFLKSVFLLYPANNKYTNNYVYTWYAESMKWKPRLVGLLKQNGKWGLIFGISANTVDIEKDTTNLKFVEVRMEQIKRLLGADQKTFAGILPSSMHKKGALADPPERIITAIAISQAINKLKTIESMPDNSTLVVIGGEGFIGSKVIEVLQKNDFPGEIISVDVKNDDEKKYSQNFYKLFGKPIILLNVSREGALKGYLPALWSQVRILNEVYPEPSSNELQIAKQLGVTCYHVSGVKAWAWPPFPRAYKGGIPCCAAWHSKEMEVIIKKLS